jgi:hypothetical protein
MKTMRIRFKRPDTRAGQMVELDEAGARRSIENGEAQEVDDEEWDLYQRELREAERKRAPAPPAPAPAAKKVTGRK